MKKQKKTKGLDEVATMNADGTLLDHHHHFITRINGIENKNKDS